MRDVVPKMLKIDIGGGTTPIPGYENCDIRELPGVKYVMKDGNLPFRVNSVDEIVSIHCLEHFTRIEASKFLFECRRVLKPGCSMILAVPCIDMVAESYKRDIKMALKHVFGSGGYAENFHKTFWTRAELKASVVDIGFISVVEEPFSWPKKHVPWWTLQLRATK